MRIRHICWSARHFSSYAFWRTCTVCLASLRVMAPLVVPTIAPLMVCHIDCPTQHPFSNELLRYVQPRPQQASFQRKSLKGMRINIKCRIHYPDSTKYGANIHRQVFSRQLSFRYNTGLIHTQQTFELVY